MSRLSKFAVLTVLLLLVVLVVWQTQQPAQSLRYQLPWKMPQQGKIQRIVFRSQFQPEFAISHQGEQWLMQQGNAPVHNDRSDLENQQVDRTLVNRFLQDLAQMQAIRIVAHGHQHDAELGMDASAVVHVELQGSDAQSLLALDVGRQGALISTYVRQASTDTVIAVDKALLWQVRRDAKSWLLSNTSPSAAPQAGQVQ